MLNSALFRCFLLFFGLFSVGPTAEKFSASALGREYQRFKVF